jgi:Tfp pilus assembly PilM family ATPase
VTEILRPEIGQLVAEINKTLVYMASRTRGKSMDCVYLAGRVARYPELVNALAQQLQIKVLALDPLEIFEVPPKASFDLSVGTLGGVALTAGLALRGWTPHE